MIQKKAYELYLESNNKELFLAEKSIEWNLPKEELLSIFANQYRDLRKATYPSIEDQLDDLFHQGAFSSEMTARLQAVKDQYPKP